jgi:hypothetical protein
LACVVALVLLSSAGLGFWLPVIAVLGFISGVYLFFNGFRMLRFKRMILNTPLSRIHSASIGLVEVNGTPVGPNVLHAPVTGDPCFYYRVQAWQWMDSGNKREWKPVLDESLCVPFFLEDGTGRVLIDPQGAMMDVHTSFSDEIPASIFHKDGLMPPNLRDFLTTRGLVPYEKIRLRQSTIPEGFPLFVFGTLGENKAGNSWTSRPHFGAVEAGISDLEMNGASVSFRLALPGKLPLEQFLSVANSARYSSELLVGRTPSMASAHPIYQSADTLQTGDGSVLMAAPIDDESRPNPAPNKSVFGPFDLHPTTAIGKGERKEPFAISGHSQRELVGKLGWRSAASIWGGPLLSLVCLYFLIAYFQWIAGTP